MLHIFMNTSENKKDPTITYLTGYDPEFCVLVYDDETRKKCLFVSGFEVGMYKGVKTFSFNGKTFVRSIKSYFSKRSIRKIGVHKSFISLSEFKRLKKLMPGTYEDNTSFFMKQRMIKSPTEIKKISKACSLADTVFLEIVSLCKKKKLTTEKDIETYIRRRALELGVGLSFDPVVATGKNSAKPHHVPGNFTLKGFTVLDFGFRYEQYCSDMTRMLYFGKPTEKEQDAYDLVLAVQIQALYALEKNVALKTVDKLVRDQLGKPFIHSLGHGVGVQIHEGPSLSPRAKERLLPGMVLTIEPGIYYSGKYGIRIEDTVSFTSKGSKILTKSKKELIII